MMKYITAVAMLIMLAGCGAATMWLYDDPLFFPINTPSQSASVKTADISILAILDAPYFPLLGQSFYSNAIPVKLTNSTNTVQIGSRGASSLSPLPVTFGGHLEDNMRYAGSKSSLRIGQQGSWSAVSAPGAL